MVGCSPAVVALAQVLLHLRQKTIADCPRRLIILRHRELGDQSAGRRAVADFAGGFGKPACTRAAAAGCSGSQWLSGA